MNINVHHYRNLSSESRSQADRLEHKLAHMEKMLMAISAEVQKVIDDITANTSLVKSVDAALKLQGTQITDLQAQIAALQAGSVLSAEDKAALVQAASDLEATNTTLQADVPANTTP